METTTAYKTFLDHDKEDNNDNIEVVMPSLRELERAKVAQLEYDLNSVKEELMSEGFVADSYGMNMTWTSEKLRINCKVLLGTLTSEVALSYYDECIGELVEEIKEVETALVADYCINKLRDLLV